MVSSPDAVYGVANIFYIDRYQSGSLPLVRTVLWLLGIIIHYMIVRGHV